jgi:clan AA aspartic protease (TIGR02281 family)
MIGEVRRSDNSEFVYLEWMYDRSKNNLLVMQATARCTARVSLPQPTSQAPTQPFGQTAQAPTQPSYSIQNDERHQPAPEPKVTTPNTPITTGKDSVPIYVSQGGTRVHVDVLLGGQVIRMLLDTGATDLKITDAVASRIVRDNQGTWQQPTKVSLADGSVHTVQVLRVREFRIGGHVVRDVDAFVGDGESMLLAFPVVNSIAPFTIDTRAGELVFHANG